MNNLSNDDLKSTLKNALEGNHETDRIEFKTGASGLGSSTYTAISSFSNTPGGGLIIWGVKEDRQESGSVIFELINLKNVQEIQEQIYSYITTKMTNVAEHEVRTIDINGSTVVVLVLSELPMESKPCYYTNKGINRGTYIRVGNVDRQATDEEVRAFIKYSPEYKYDQTALSQIERDSLDMDKLNLYLTASAERTGRTIDSSRSIETVLANKNILVNQNNKYIPTLAGALLFLEDDPQDHKGLDRYVVRCIRYEGNSPSSNILDNMDIFGTLDAQVDRSLNFILRNISQSARIEGSQRVDRYEYPEEALRELVVNAIIHRDYSIKETYVQIAIFSDRIEFSNPGVLPPGITVDNLKESQFSRNTVIAGTMRDLKYMEEFGRGIDLIYSQVREWSLPEPLFKNRSNTFKATILSDAFSHLNDRQISIWNELQNRSSITARAILKQFPDNSRATINNDIRVLLDSNLIRQEGSGVNTYYEANY